ncbi:protein of unknown function [Tenacibaculum aestuariivivum]
MINLLWGSTALLQEIVIVVLLLLITCVVGKPSFASTKLRILQGEINNNSTSPKRGIVFCIVFMFNFFFTLLRYSIEIG